MDDLTIPDFDRTTTRARSQSIEATFSAAAFSVGVAFEDLLLATTLPTTLWRAPAGTPALSGREQDLAPRSDERDLAPAHRRDDRDDPVTDRQDEFVREKAPAAEAESSDRAADSIYAARQAASPPASDVGLEASAPVTAEGAAGGDLESDTTALPMSDAVAVAVPEPTAVPLTAGPGLSVGAAAEQTNTGTAGNPNPLQGESNPSTKDPALRSGGTDGSLASSVANGAANAGQSARPAASPVSRDTNDTSQAQSTPQNRAPAADPRLAQANFSITKEAETLQSSPSSTLTAAAAVHGSTTNAAPKPRRQANSAIAAGTQPGAAGSASPVTMATAAGVATPSVPQAVNPVSAPSDGAAGRPSLPSTGLGTPAVGGDAALADAGTGAPQGRFVDELRAKEPPLPVSRKPTLGDQVSVHITKAIKNGIDRINIQLKPQSLGRVDVHLELAADGRVTATVTADSRQAFDLLQQDARELEQALQQAGLKTDSNSLSFNLRGQNNPNGRDQEALAGGGKPSADAIDLVADADDGVPEPGSDHDGPGAGRLDIRA